MPKVYITVYQSIYPCGYYVITASFSSVASSFVIINNIIIVIIIIKNNNIIIFILINLLTYLLTCRCRHSTGIKHFNVERTTTTFYLKDIQFTTLDQLVRYYGNADVPNKELIRGVRLRTPINRSVPSQRMYDESDRMSTASSDVYIHPVRWPTFFGLHFRRRLYSSIFNHFDVIGP